MSEESQPTPAAVVEKPSPPKRPRIKTIEICDFRAFPGPTPVNIELGGKNLFVFGENGVGKSTIFQALDGIFAYGLIGDELAQELKNQENRFTVGAEKDKTFVSITYDDDKPKATWSAEGHPTDTIPGPADERIVNAAWAKAILDYRSLLKTNYDHGDDEVNLFDVCVKHLLRDYPTISGERLGELWQRLQAKLRLGKIRTAHRDEINDDSRKFNDGLDEATKAILPLINPILKDLGCNDIELTALVPKRIAYNNAPSKEDRAYKDCTVAPEIAFHGQLVGHPQLFLNEARLSALALAIYFAGRKLAEKQTQNDMPRIMVLDDVLIGLDQANRVPLLDVLAKYFRDWQVIILTHDRVWFDIARHYQRVGQADKFWTYWQLHQPHDHHFAPIATDVASSIAAQALDTARKFLRDGHVHAAGNAARLATEFGLREFCATKDVPVPYVLPPKVPAASEFLDCVEMFDKGAGHYKSVIDSIRMYTTILLNPLSHGGTSEVTPSEVMGAIEVVDKLLFALKVLPTNAMKRRKL
ncbi:AAA family ATPase [Rhizobium ruizarguesonis]|uniref:AAA family ATPase n=1 Tax=Rhizobium ruizarguesonis TaxID=2081791 RepID=UPI0013B84D2F|nr:AAA family ATPase [Rhizobium ruizarguesonis]NEJ64891.1 AAA family ATPase [Rhizobium ruizarguesonis]